MKNFLPPSVSPSGEEPTATDGRQDLEDRKQTEHFAAACDAVGEEPIAMGGWRF
jgi:hypothetical protein